MASKEQIRKAAEADLLTFIKLIAPHRVIGAIHEEVCRWWIRDEALDNQLILLPRDHQKSWLVAARVAWWLTRHPDITILYVSATADLAEKQLKSIKDIITSDIYRFYWPEMVNASENKRERWAVDEISVDHPIRKQEGVRDPTVKAVGLTANTTGLHCRVAVLDDIVVPSNAYTEIGREQVRAFYSQLSSIETTDAKEWVVGTRYHPADIYRDLIDMTEAYTDENNEDIERAVFEVFERAVESNGEFLWPRQRRYDGKVFGFDEKILARKKAKYLDVTQFYAQYYNNPNAAGTQLVDPSKFQYYNREKLVNLSGGWYLDNELLSVYAGIDFAFSLGERSDYTAIVVVGVNRDGFIFVLDIDRFRTNKVSEMYARVEKAYRKWGFRKLRAEVTAGQSLIVAQFKEFMRKQGVAIAIDEYRPTKNKEERIQAALEPRYQQGVLWHYKGGNCQVLEEEVVMEHPEHDDVKDCLASVLDIVKPPARNARIKTEGNVVFSNRFGGVAFA